MPSPAFRAARSLGGAGAQQAAHGSRGRAHGSRGRAIGELRLLDVRELLLVPRLRSRLGRLPPVGRGAFPGSDRGREDGRPMAAGPRRPVRHGSDKRRGQANAWFGEAFGPELQDAQAPAGPAASAASSSPTLVALRPGRPEHEERTG